MRDVLLSDEEITRPDEFAQAVLGTFPPSLLMTETGTGMDWVSVFRYESEDPAYALTTSEDLHGQALTGMLISSRTGIVEVHSWLGDMITFEVAASQPEWLESVFAELEALRTLPHNWNSYGAAPLDADAVSFAGELLRLGVAGDSVQPSIVPAAKGGVQLEWHTLKHDLEIEVLPGNALRMSFEEVGQPSLEVERTDIWGVLPYLAKIGS